MMEYELDIRLEALSLVSRENVRGNSQNDCLFQAYVDFVKNYDIHSPAFKSYAEDDARAGVLRGRSLAKFDHLDREPGSPDKEVAFFVDECEGLRHLVSVAVLEYALTPHKVRDSLLKHIADRFAQPSASEDLQQAQLQPLPDGATQEDMVRKWAALMAGSGDISYTNSCEMHGETCMACIEIHASTPVHRNPVLTRT
jgi:hypothetical protein